MFLFSNEPELKRKLPFTHTKIHLLPLKGLLLFQSIMIPIRLSVCLAFSDNFWRQKLQLKLIFQTFKI